MNRRARVLVAAAAVAGLCGCVPRYVPTVPAHHYSRPTVAPCRVILPGANNAPDSGPADGWDWLWETVHAVDYRPNVTGHGGTWWVQDAAGQRWHVLGYSAAEDADVWNRAGCPA